MKDSHCEYFSKNKYHSEHNYKSIVRNNLKKLRSLEYLEINIKNGKDNEEKDSF